MPHSDGLLREQLERERDRADCAEQRVDHLDGELTAERTRVDGLHARVASLTAELVVAQFERDQAIIEAGRERAGRAAEQAAAEYAAVEYAAARVKRETQAVRAEVEAMRRETGRDGRQRTAPREAHMP